MDTAEWFAAKILPHEPALRAWLRGKRMPGLDVNDIIQETYAVLAAKHDWRRTCQVKREYSSTEIYR